MKNAALLPWDSARHNLNPPGCDRLLPLGSIFVKPSSCDFDLIKQLEIETAVTLATINSLLTQLSHRGPGFNNKKERMSPYLINRTKA